ncbi:MAG: lipoyl(octanoyl) transferase LipB [Deltaproteobacteria bacterium]
MNQRGYIIDLGLMDYGQAWDLQHLLWSRRVGGELQDLLLFVEHPHVITLGRRGNRSHLLASPETLKEKGVSIFHVERGGDITYHGPGQMVVYPILHLKDYGYRVVRYVEQLEEVIIRVLRDFGIEGKRDVLNRGVWVKKDKIASIGVAIKRWVSFHGLALNYGTDLSYFDLIDPCGLEGVKITSMEKILGTKISRDHLYRRMVFHFEEIFEKQWKRKELSDIVTDERSAKATLAEDPALSTSGHV